MDGADESLEWFQPTSGRVTGALALAVAGSAVVVAWLERGQSFAPALALGAAFAGVVAWAAMLRPGVAVSPTTLVLRNMFETIHVPLVAIEELAVRQVLAVRTAQRRYVSPAIGQSWRRLMGPASDGSPDLTPEQALARSYADFVEARIRHLCDEARSLEGIRRGSAEQVARAADVRRDPAWLEIALLGVTAVGFLIAVFL